MLYPQSLDPGVSASVISYIVNDILGRIAAVFVGGGGARVLVEQSMFIFR